MSAAQLDPTLDDFDSEDEPAAKADLGSAQLAVSAVSREARALLDGWEAQPGGGGAKLVRRKRRARPGKAGLKKGRQGSPDDSPGVADELELDTEFVVAGDGGSVASSDSNGLADGWEACAASRVRLLARMQAHASEQAQRRNVAEDNATGQEGEQQLALRNGTAAMASMRAVDELLQAFEDAHAKLSSFAQPALQGQQYL